jgi:hypothetical protein
MPEGWGRLFARYRETRRSPLTTGRRGGGSRRWRAGARPLRAGPSALLPSTRAAGPPAGRAIGRTQRRNTLSRPRPIRGSGWGLRRPGAPPWTRTPTSGESSRATSSVTGEWWWSGRGLTHDGAPEGCQTVRAAASATQPHGCRPFRERALDPARTARQGRARRRGRDPEHGPCGGRRGRYDRYGLPIDFRRAAGRIGGRNPVWLRFAA